MLAMKMLVQVSSFFGVKRGCLLSLRESHGKIMDNLCYSRSTVNFICVWFKSYSHRQPKFSLETSRQILLGAEQFIISPISAVSREYFISLSHSPLWIFSRCHGNDSELQPLKLTSNALGFQRATFHGFVRKGDNFYCREQEASMQNITAYCLLYPSKARLLRRGKRNFIYSH